MGGYGVFGPHNLWPSRKGKHRLYDVIIVAENDAGIGQRAKVKAHDSWFHDAAQRAFHEWPPQGVPPRGSRQGIGGEQVKWGVVGAGGLITVRGPAFQTRAQLA